MQEEVAGGGQGPPSSSNGGGGGGPAALPGGNGDGGTKEAAEERDPVPGGHARRHLLRGAAAGEGKKSLKCAENTFFARGHFFKKMICAFWDQIF